MSFLGQALVFLAAAAIAVPISKRLGLGSVLAYLLAGVALGPWGLRVSGDVDSTLHLAELGVVLLLFTIGLELQPSKLWALRSSVFGHGSFQVGVTSAIIAGLGWYFGLDPTAAVIAGIGLSLSSTAFALQLLAEKGQLGAPHGRVAFGVLLFQDLAVIPLLAVLPLLSPVASSGPEIPFWLSAAKVIGVLIAVIGGGRYVLRPLFRIVAATRSQEVFTAFALLVVVGTALLLQAVGLSMALGAFLAGVLLADSEYRTELEADLEPFKGLLMGLFFMAVGMSVQLGLVAARPLLVAVLVLGLVGIKAAVLFVLGRRALGNTLSALSLAVVISQGGEFALVLFRLASGLELMKRDVSDLLVVVVSISMAVSPLLYLVYERWLRPRLERGDAKPFDVAPDEDTPVIVAGFGRMGQVVGRVLRARRIPFTAMDSNPEHIEFIRRFGNKVFFGDASRLDLLRAARADKAKVFVLAIDDVEASMRTARMVLEHFPHLTLLARARNRQHAYQLMGLGITHIIRETFDSSVELTVGVLEALGLPAAEAKVAGERFRAHDLALLKSAHPYQGDLQKLVEVNNNARAELESIFERDALDNGALASSTPDGYSEPTRDRV